MDIAASEALERVRRWEKRATYLNGMLLSNSSLMLVKFAGRVTIHKDVITFMENSFEFCLSLTPTMAFKYSNAGLEIIAAEWCAVLYEPKEWTR
jgi:hypothetical protein